MSWFSIHSWTSSINFISVLIAYCSSYTFIFGAIITDDLVFIWKNKEKRIHNIRWIGMRQSHVHHISNVYVFVCVYTWKQSTEYCLSDSKICLFCLVFLFTSHIHLILSFTFCLPVVFTFCWRFLQSIFSIGNFTAGRDKLSWFECNYVYIYEYFICVYKICEIPMITDVWFRLHSFAHTLSFVYTRQFHVYTHEYRYGLLYLLLPACMPHFSLLFKSSLPKVERNWEH